eukprot:scaffold430_cov187-Alexandrium_tamarense.AAC.11
MAPERRLIPTEEGTASLLQCTSNVVGVIPPQIHELLSSTTSRDGTPSVRGGVRGRIDDHSSGLSFLLHTSSGIDDVNAISIWEHSTQTLMEELIAPTSSSPTLLLHPEHCGSQFDLLVACLGPDQGYTPGRGGDHHHHRSLRHVYAASPDSGVVCLWTLDGSHPSATHSLQRTEGRDDAADTVECDASVRLPLRQGELLTALTPIEGGSSWMLAATSFGRIWKLTKTSRPLGLRAKLVEAQSVIEGNGGGIVGGLFSLIGMTPKTTGREGRGHAAASAGSKGVEEGEGMEQTHENIVALVQFAPVGSKGGPVRSPPPRKVQRVLSPSPSNTARDGNSAHVASLSSNLVLKEWKVSLLVESEHHSRGDNSEVNEGYISQKEFFPRNGDGTLNLGNLCSGGELTGYRHVDIIAPPSIAKDGRSLIVPIRIARDANGSDESTRVYVLRIALGAERDDEGPQIIDAAWLDRYSGESISVIGGSLECAGLVTAEENGGEDGGVVVYVGFGPRDGVDDGGNAADSACPVTISVIHFPRVTADGDAMEAPRVKDLDLFSNVVPSIVMGCMSYDSTTGGCVFLATSGLLGGTSVRFPRNLSNEKSCMTDLSGSIEALAQDDAVLTIKSHLQSSFRQYLNKLKDGTTNPASVARTVVPPSVGSCSSSVLSAAVVLASKDLLVAGGGRGGLHSPFASRNSAMTVLRDTLELHKHFVTYLHHAGAYRKVSVAGRTKLRDHGEMVAATRATLSDCQGYFSSADGTAMDDERRGEIAQVRQMITNTFDGIAENVLDLPRRWAALQQLPINNSTDLLMISSMAVCNGIGRALGYRQDESGILYDIPSFDASIDSTVAPWTSSAEVLTVIQTQLQNIQQSGSGDETLLRPYVEDLSASLLGGYRDIVLREAGDGNALQAYEEAKLLAIPLLRRFAHDGGADIVALRASLAHACFEAICNICNEHRATWLFQGPFSDLEPDETYDIRAMMSTSSDSPYANLHQSRDYQTGLGFCDYVFRWYADRGSHPEVFELGKECPATLTRYLRTDDRLSNLAWLQDLRTGSYDDATYGAMSNLTSPVLPSRDSDGPMGLWEKEQMLSIAKLSNMRVKSPNSVIENGLTLINAQRVLQDEDIDGHGSEVAMTADDLLVLAVNKIKASQDVDECKRFAIAGLCVASAVPTDQAEHAALVWEACIGADMDTWNNISREASSSVAGIAKEDLMRLCESTLFVALAEAFATTPEESMKGVGFLSNVAVKDEVVQSLGLNQNFEQLLLRSAELVSN